MNDVSQKVVFSFSKGFFVKFFKKVFCKVLKKVLKKDMQQKKITKQSIIIKLVGQEKDLNI